MAELLAVRHNYGSFQISEVFYVIIIIIKKCHVLGTVGYVDESDIEIYKGHKYQNAKFVGKTGLEKFIMIIYMEIQDLKLLKWM